MGLLDYLEFIPIFIGFMFIIVLILYPIDQFFPWFDSLVPFLKGISIFQFIKEHSYLIFPILLISFFGYVYIHET